MTIFSDCQKEDGGLAGGTTASQAPILLKVINTCHCEFLRSNLKFLPNTDESERFLLHYSPRVITFYIVKTLPLFYQKIGKTVSGVSKGKAIEL